MTEAELDQAEDELRSRVTALPPDLRRIYYRNAEKLIRDPDTYVLLNYAAPAGLHHFYLGNTTRGGIDLALFLTGLALIPVFGIGLLIILGVFIAELPQMIKARSIVRQHNLETGRALLTDLGLESPFAAHASLAGPFGPDP